MSDLGEPVSRYLGDHASIYISEGMLYNEVVLWGTFAYALVSLYSLISMSVAYIQAARGGSKMNSDVRKEIFRKQIAYFLVLNLMELPHIGVVVERYLS